MFSQIFQKIIEKDNETSSSLIKLLENDKFMHQLIQEQRQQHINNNYEKFKKKFEFSKERILKELKELKDKIEKQNQNEIISEFEGDINTGICLNCYKNKQIQEHKFLTNNEIFDTLQTREEMEYDIKKQEWETLRKKAENYLESDIAFSLDVMEADYDFSIFNTYQNKLDIPNIKKENVFSDSFKFTTIQTPFTPPQLKFKSNKKDSSNVLKNAGELLLRKKQ